ncbi:MAG: tripartite tricarboxylate transporter substrate-binding protein [Xanthobacteraceae bacterium]
METLQQAIKGAMSIDRRRLVLCISAFAGQGLAAAAFAQNWPDRSIVILVPFPAGGSADLSARLLAENLKVALGQPAAVENKPGAGGNLAAAEAARAEPDGYTLFIGTNGTQTINQSLYRQLPYDPAADFAPIAMMWSAPHLLVVDPSVPARSLEEFIAYARAHPGLLSYGSSGIGSSTHLFGEMFKVRTGVDIVHVPYRGQGRALEDLIAGRIGVMFPIVPDVIEAIRADQVRALALASAEASGVLPDVPLMRRLGYPDLVASAWIALYAPARTPGAVIERLRAQTESLMTSADFIARMKQVGIEIHGMRREEFAAFTEAERRRWANVIASLGLRLQ